MTTQNFVVPGRLPGWNEMQTAAGGHWAVAYRKKQEAMKAVMSWAALAKIHAVADGCEVHIACYEPNKKRDNDNVQSGAKKIVLDALQNAGIIRNDNQSCLRQCSCTVHHDKDLPRIEIAVIGEKCEKHKRKA